MNGPLIANFAMSGPFINLRPPAAWLSQRMGAEIRSDAALRGSVAGGVLVIDGDAPVELGGAR
jgi:hypothetical protein